MPLCWVKRICPLFTIQLFLWEIYLFPLRRNKLTIFLEIAALLQKLCLSVQMFYEKLELLSCYFRQYPENITCVCVCVLLFTSAIDYYIQKLRILYKTLLSYLWLILSSFNKLSAVSAQLCLWERGSNSALQVFYLH